LAQGLKEKYALNTPYYRYHLPDGSPADIWFQTIRLRGQRKTIQESRQK
jgi:hypothetical protein